MDVASLLCQCPHPTLNNTETQANLVLSGGRSYRECPHLALTNASVQACLVLSGDRAYYQCPSPLGSTNTTQTGLVWGSIHKWCKCPNLVSTDPITQVTIIYDSSSLVCRCPAPTGWLRKGKAYCTCPKVIVDGIGLRLALNPSTYSCHCPQPAIYNTSKGVNIINSTGNCACECK